jgi:itaconate CoA-transferase
MAKAGISIADISAGVTAYHSILAALLRRDKIERGDHIDVSMLEAMAEWMGFPMYFAFDGAPPPRRNGAGHATIYPYGPFETVDGIVFLGLQNDREWILFAEAVLRRPDLAADPRFKGNAGRADHHDLLEPILVGILSTLSTEEAMARLEHAGIATAHVNDMADLWSHPQLAARDRWRQVGSPVGAAPGPEAGHRRRMGAAPRPRSAFGRTHRRDPCRIRP